MLTIFFAAILSTPIQTPTEPQSAAGEVPQRGGPLRLSVLGQVHVGGTPRGIRFRDGAAWIAVADADEILAVDLETLEIGDRLAVSGSPVDLINAGNGSWNVSILGENRLRTLPPEPGRSHAIELGSGPSLFRRIDPKRTLLSLAEGNELLVLNSNGTELLDRFPCSARPCASDATPDGVLAFVPGYDADEVTVIDLLNGSEVERVSVGKGPSGGAVTRDGVSYVVVCSGSDEILFLNTASFDLTGGVKVGPRPSAIVMLDDETYALVSLADGNSVALVDLAAKRVVETVATGGGPNGLRLEPGGERVWVSNEKVGTVSIVSVPVAPALPQSSDVKSEVVVLGMIHGSHLTSERYGLDVLRDALRRAEPDFVCAEIPPNRFDRAMRSFREEGAVTEPRVARFPEYVDVVFPLLDELGYSILPTAGWTEPMASFRRAALARIEADQNRSEDWLRYTAAMQSMDEALTAGGAPDDPLWIHTEAYDDATELGFGVYNELFNDELGPGGWDNINAAHFAPLAAALDRRRGEGRRFVVTYGAAHKGWLLRALRERDDVALIDARKFFQ